MLPTQKSIFDIFFFGKETEQESPCQPITIDNPENILDLEKEYSSLRCTHYYNYQQLLKNYIIEGETPFEIWFNTTKPFMETVFTSFIDLSLQASNIDWASQSIIYAIETGKQTSNSLINIASQIDSTLSYMDDQYELLELQKLSPQGRMADALANRSGSITRLLPLIQEEQHILSESQTDTLSLIQNLQQQKSILEEIIQNTELIYDDRGPLDRFYPKEFDYNLSKDIKTQAQADTSYINELINQIQTPTPEEDLEWILFRPYPSPPHNYLLIREDGTNIEESLIHKSLKWPTISNDGTKLAGITYDDFIEIIDLENPNNNKILDVRILNPRGFSWSPNDSNIVISEYHHLSIIDIDKEEKKQITFDEETNEITPFWHPDGRHILYSKGGSWSFESYNIYQLEIDPETLEPIGEPILVRRTYGDAYWPSVNPITGALTYADNTIHGTQILVSYPNNYSSIEFDIFGYFTRPNWNKEGTKLLFMTGVIHVKNFVTGDTKVIGSEEMYYASYPVWYPRKN
jgi:flagellar biosynthesis/type III secretory pathway chaperone